MDLARIWAVTERARGRGPLTADEVVFVEEVIPRDLDAFPRLKLPTAIKHPAGFSVSGASVGTFLRSALLIAGQKALGRRFGGAAFYEKVEEDLAFKIMRSHFHNGYPKGAFCCAQCTLAVYTVLEVGAIRYFDCTPLAKDVRNLVQQGKWRFAGATNQAMVNWALGNSG